MAPKARVIFDSKEGKYFVQRKGLIYWNDAVDTWDKRRHWHTFKDALAFASKCSVFVVVEHSKDDYNAFEG